MNQTNTKQMKRRHQDKRAYQLVSKSENKTPLNSLVLKSHKEKLEREAPPSL